MVESRLVAVEDPKGRVWCSGPHADHGGGREVIAKKYGVEYGIGVS